MIDEREMVAPSDACRRLRHPTQWFQASAPGDKIEVCAVCSLARRDALRAGKSDRFADAYVQRLRRDTTPYDEEENDGPEAGS